MEVDNQADVKMLQAEVAELQSKLRETQTENRKLREKSEYHQAWGEKIAISLSDYRDRFLFTTKTEPSFPTDEYSRTPYE